MTTSKNPALGVFALTCHVKRPCNKLVQTFRGWETLVLQSKQMLNTKSLNFINYPWLFFVGFFFFLHPVAPPRSNDKS